MSFLFEFLFKNVLNLEYEWPKEFLNSFSNYMPSNLTHSQILSSLQQISENEQSYM
jgi:hypothetical protein